MKKALFLFTMIFLFQSCYTYKSATVDNLEAKKNYVIQLKRGGKEIDGKYISKTKDSILFRVNKRTIHFPASEIQYIKRKKVSTLMIIAGATAVTVGSIILINQSNEKNGEIDDIPTPNN